jgi:nucleotide-binding universal stress UspA family protein
MTRLLVPIDASENAARALHHAIGCAKRDGTVELQIVNVHEPPNLAGEVSIFLSEEEAARAAGVRFETVVLTGEVPDAIVRCADMLGCEGIIMGTHGRSAFGNLLLGSVATEVIHRTRLPVTLVK